MMIITTVWTGLMNLLAVSTSDQTIVDHHLQYLDVTCSTEEFQCADRGCIQARWRCDGQKDCGDGSDENDCVVTNCDPSEELACGDGRCVNKRWRCDGDMDCDDGADEKGCKHQVNSTVECKEDSFGCLSKGECIIAGWKCDGEADCADGSDESEEICGVTPKCKEDQFECRSGECIPSHLRCSQTVECVDGSDEEDCDGVEVDDCDPALYFRCQVTGICLPLDRVCDRVNDCGGWEDEDNCGDEDDCDDDNGGCDQICIETNNSSSVCDCQQGFLLVGKTACNGKYQTLCRVNCGKRVIVVNG